jgi:hypothetical protein
VRWWESIPLSGKVRGSSPLASTNLNQAVTRAFSTRFSTREALSMASASAEPNTSITFTTCVARA